MSAIADDRRPEEPAVGLESCFARPMVRAKANGIELEYEVIGSATAEPMLLVMGFTMQMIHWPDGFIERLVARGYRVIRFDNRDAGLSTKLERPYTLEDMAEDTVGLIQDRHRLGGPPAEHLDPAEHVARLERLRVQLERLLCLSASPVQVAREEIHPGHVEVHEQRQRFEAHRDAALRDVRELEPLGALVAGATADALGGLAPAIWLVAGVTFGSGASSEPHRGSGAVGGRLVGGRSRRRGGSRF